MTGTAAIEVSRVEASSAGPELPALTPAQLQLRQMVLDSVTLTHFAAGVRERSRPALSFAASRPLTRALLMEYRASMEDLAPSTVNVRLAAVRKMVTEAKRNGLLSQEEAASLTDVPNIRQKGTRLGNWLTKEQARELLAVPDRSTVKGKRDYAILALLVGCALRRRELASLTVEDIQMRENRWVIADLRGKGGRVRTVAVPLWVKHGINACRLRARLRGDRCCALSPKVESSGKA